MTRMRRGMILTLVGLLVTAVGADAQGAADSAAIRSAALDYIEGWYEGDEARMERALHPKLAKRIATPGPGGRTMLVETSALELVQQTRAGGASGTAEDERRTEVTILDLFNGAASVRVDAHDWIDYMHLARFGEGWVIVNVLWEFRDPGR